MASAFASSVRGCLFGGAIGDAFGSAYEGTTPPVKIDDNAPWVITDDTQLTLATCEAISLSGGVDPETVARKMAAWYRAGRVMRLGSSTLKALRELSQGGHWALCGRRGEMAAGCGPATRAAPLAFWLDPAVADDRQRIRDLARITHHSDEAYAGALAVIGAVRAAVYGGWRGDPDLSAFVSPLLPDTRVRDRLAELSASSRTQSLNELAEEYGSSGYVVEAVPLALCAAERMVRDGFGIVLRELVLAGGDTDSIAAIAGQVAGAAVGVDGIPAELMARIPGFAEIDRIAADFTATLNLRSKEC